MARFVIWNDKAPEIGRVIFSGFQSVEKAEEALNEYIRIFGGSGDGFHYEIEEE